MNSRFHPEAYEEFLAAARWYEDQEPGLGDDFSSEIHHAILAIEADPLRFPFVEKPDRVYRVKRFPYSIFYRYDQSSGSVLIYSVFHQKRQPDIWQKRTFD